MLLTEELNRQKDKLYHQSSVNQKIGMGLQQNLWYLCPMVQNHKSATKHIIKENTAFSDTFSGIYTDYFCGLQGASSCPFHHYFGEFRWLTAKMVQAKNGRNVNRRTVRSHSHSHDLTAMKSSLSSLVCYLGPTEPI
jgi:hypothetical protein